MTADTDGPAASLRLPLTGGCQCGAVRYEVTAEPLTLYACHCHDCQQQSGSAFALSMILPRPALRVTTGAPQHWERPGCRTASGTSAVCLFCAACGARLYHLPARSPGIAVLKPGTLDDTRWLDPIGHIWIKSAQPWVAIPAGLLTYEGSPPDLAALQAAWRARREARANPDDA